MARWLQSVTPAEFDAAMFAAALEAYKAGDYDKAWRLSFSADTPAMRRLRELALKKYPAYEVCGWEEGD